ncbi:MAG: peptidoglycan DD-metalloendopeptidase family protein [Bacteroidota bacterium]
MKKAFLALLIFCLTAGLLQAQPTGDKAQLEKEREDIQKELQEIQGLYNKVKGQTKQSIGQLNMLKNKINLQERYINNINKELKMIDDDIYLSNLEIYRLQKQLDTLKAQYARTVVYTYKNRSAYDYLNFIFSAGSFNDAIRRVAYLKSYRSYREKQVTTILETRQLISKRKQQQLGRKEQKNVALQNQTKQVNELAIQKKEKDAVVSKLKSQEKDLQKQLAEKKKRDRDLNNAILAIVRREIKEAEARAAAEAKKNAATNLVTNPVTNNANTEPVTRTAAAKKPLSYLNLNAKDVALNSSFESNRGRLPWPVDNGVVTYHFGTNNVEGTLLKFDSPGITITTPSPGAAVKVVFDGEVAVVNNNGDGSYAVLVRHGKYFTTYSNLVSVTVNKGSDVKTGQIIGKSGRDDDSSGGQIDFILMIETKNVNPETWLRH